MMARIRSLHPGQWTDEAFVSCSLGARLLALGLRNEADDNGVFEWKPLTIKMRLFPADAVDIVVLLQELEETGQLRRFDVAGRSFGAIKNFRKWQRPEKPKGVHPLPDELATFVGLSSTDRRPVADSSANLFAEEGGRREEVGGTDADASDILSTPAPRVVWPADAFSRFWARYPSKVGKGKAEQSFAKAARTKGLTFDRLMAGLETYIARKPKEREWCNPSTWLNQERWNDEWPAEDALPPRSQPSERHQSRRPSAHENLIAGFAAVAERHDASGGLDDPPRDDPDFGDAYGGPTLDLAPGRGGDRRGDDRRSGEFDIGDSREAPRRLPGH